MPKKPLVPGRGKAKAAAQKIAKAKRSASKDADRIVRQGKPNDRQYSYLE
jgi:hypothetical protein